MGDLQDPIDGGTVSTVPYVWPYFVGIFPEIQAKNIWQVPPFQDPEIAIDGS